MGVKVIKNDVHLLNMLVAGKINDAPYLMTLNYEIPKILIKVYNDGRSRKVIIAHYHEDRHSTV